MYLCDLNKCESAHEKWCMEVNMSAWLVSLCFQHIKRMNGSFFNILLVFDFVYFLFIQLCVCARLFMIYCCCCDAGSSTFSGYLWIFLRFNLMQFCKCGMVSICVPNSKPRIDSAWLLSSFIGLCFVSCQIFSPF